jgi:glycerophosphoryl diester phosphodiesterase
MSRILLYAILLLALVAGDRQTPSAQTPAVQAPLDVRLFGHRGFTRAVPENSLASLNAAAALGLAGAEIDLRTTRDGDVVLMHDATVDRTTNGAGLVKEMTRDAVERLRLKHPDGTVTADPVPDLTAVLAFLTRHARFRVAFDAKEIDVAAVGRRVLAAGVQDRVMFFIDDMADAERAKAIKRVDPRLKLSINLRAWWQIEGLATFARTALDADALFAHEFYLPRFGFQEAARTGAEVQVYLPGVENLVERFKRAAGMGANLVSSDRPDLLVPLVLPGPQNRTRSAISSPSGSSR